MDVRSLDGDPELQKCSPCLSKPALTALVRETMRQQDKSISSLSFGKDYSCCLPESLVTHFCESVNARTDITSLADWRGEQTELRRASLYQKAEFEDVGP